MNEESYTSTQLERFKEIGNPMKVNFDKQTVQKFMNERPLHESTIFDDRQKYTENNDDENSEDGVFTLDNDNERPDIEGQKEFYYSELLKMKNVGRNFTRDDSLEDLEFLYQRTKAANDCDSTVEFLKSGMKVLFTGIEMGNNAIGPILSLDGYAASQDVEKYDSCLRRIYKTYYRMGTVNPILELCMLLCGSLVMHHFSNKIFGGNTANMNIPTKANQRVGKKVNFDVKRPSMKRPDLN